MNRHVEFSFGIIILFFMAVVLWKFIEPAPLEQVTEEQPSQQVERPEIIEAPPETPMPEWPIDGTPLPLPVEPSPREENPAQPVACTMEAKMCSDGSFVGRQGPNCEFVLCPGEVAEEKSVSYCGPRSNEEVMCTEIYTPVCARVQVECVTTPCNPVPQTFSNSCFACANDRVVSYAEGACE
jgi:hypothetical protein